MDPEINLVIFKFTLGLQLILIELKTNQIVGPTVEKVVSYQVRL